MCSSDLALTKRHRVAEWIQKQDLYLCCLQETHFTSKETQRLKGKGWKKVFHANGNKKAGVTILISDKIDFKTKTVTRDKEGYYTVIKGSIQEEDITNINIYAPNIGSPKYIKEILTDIKGEINSNAIRVGDFTTPVTSMDRSPREKTNKETLAINDTLDQMDLLIDIHRTFHPKAAEHTFFSSTQGTSSRIDHMLSHETSLSKIKKIEIISSIFPTTML